MCGAHILIRFQSISWERAELDSNIQTHSNVMSFNYCNEDIFIGISNTQHKAVQNWRLLFEVGINHSNYSDPTVIFILK